MYVELKAYSCSAISFYLYLISIWVFLFIAVNFDSNRTIIAQPNRYGVRTHEFIAIVINGLVCVGFSYLSFIIFCSLVKNIYSQTIIRFFLSIYLPQHVIEFGHAQYLSSPFQIFTLVYDLILFASDNMHVCN